VREGIGAELKDSNLTRICPRGRCGMPPSKDTLKGRLSRYRQIKYEAKDAKRYQSLMWRF